MLDLKMKSDITTFAVGQQMKSIVSHSHTKFIKITTLWKQRFSTTEANKQHVGNFTSQEWQRVLGQSGDTVFKKHYQSQFIGRDLQHVILL